MNANATFWRALHVTPATVCVRDHHVAIKVEHLHDDTYYSDDYMVIIGQLNHDYLMLRTSIGIPWIKNMAVGSIIM